MRGFPFSSFSTLLCITFPYNILQVLISVIVVLAIALIITGKYTLLYMLPYLDIVLLIIPHMTYYILNTDSHDSHPLMYIQLKIAIYILLLTFAHLYTEIHSHNVIDIDKDYDSIDRHLTI